MHPKSGELNVMFQTNHLEAKPTDRTPVNRRPIQTPSLARGGYATENRRCCLSLRRIIS